MAFSASVGRKIFLPSSLDVYIEAHFLFRSLKDVLDPTFFSYPLLGPWLMRITMSCLSMLSPKGAALAIPPLPTRAHVPYLAALFSSGSTEKGEVRGRKRSGRER